MRLSFQNIFFATTVLLSCFLFFSCDKVNVTLQNQTQTANPDISYFQAFPVTLQTLQVDSFLTSSQGIFTIGYQNDPVFGITHATSYTELQLPAVNPIGDVNNVSFDSLEVVLRPKGNYYGDTLAPPFNIRIYQLSQLIQNVDINDNNFYNNQSVAFNSTPLYDTTFRVFPHRTGTDISMKISADPLGPGHALGVDLFNKFRMLSDEVSSQAKFNNYFAGLAFDCNTSATNAIYGFGPTTDSVVMRLYYGVHGLTTVEKSIDFPFIPSKQFTHFSYDRTGKSVPSATQFINNVALTNSSETGSKAYLNSSMGYYIKMSFPTILTLKQFHPYIQVLSAQVVIPPSFGTYNYPYTLPPSLTLYTTDNTNRIISAALSSSGTDQNGDLFIDNLGGQSTGYTYDVTNYINTLLNAGTADENSALILSPSTNLGDQTLNRLVINDQSSTKGIELRLYVLGL